LGYEGEVAGPNVKPPAVLAIDPDASTQKLIAPAFNRSGAFLLRYISDPRKTAGCTPSWTRR
jgi:hypothetical protein